MSKKSDNYVVPEKSRAAKTYVRSINDWLGSR